MKKTMAIIGAFMLASIFFFSCTVKDPNSSPENVMNTIFESAKSGEVEVLRSLLPPDESCDGDCKGICNPGNESMKEKLGPNYVSLDEFKEYFSQGKIVGSPKINGNEAEVNFLFGPNSPKRNETMHMQKINGKWYLSGF